MDKVLSMPTNAHNGTRRSHEQHKYDHRLPGFEHSIASHNIIIIIIKNNNNKTYHTHPKPNTLQTKHIPKALSIMAFMLKNKAAFWQAIKATRSNTHQDNKPVPHINMCIDQGNQIITISRLPAPLLKCFCPNAEVSSQGVVVKADAEALKDICNWITDCQSQERVIPFPRYQELPYYHYLRVKEVAQDLQFTGLVQEMISRSSKLAAGQIHCDDIRKVYSLAGNNQGHRLLVTASISKAIKEDRLKAPRQVKKLREEVPAFEKDLLSMLPAELSAEITRAPGQYTLNLSEVATIRLRRK